MKTCRTAGMRFLFVFCLLAVLLLAGGCFRSAQSGEKVRLSSDMVDLGLYGSSPVYTGEPIELDPSGFRIATGTPGVWANIGDFTFTYRNNTDVGTATIVITAKDTCTTVYGSTELTFSIVPAGVQADTYEALCRALANPNYDQITLSHAITIPAQEKLTVPEGVQLFTVPDLQITLEGTMEICGSFQLSGKTTLINHGSLINSGTLLIGERASVFCLGTFSQSGTVTNRGTVYINDRPHPSVPGNQCVRLPLSETDITLQHPSVIYTPGQEFYEPGQITLLSASGAHIDGGRYSPVCRDNTGAGTAWVDLRAEPLDPYFYGSASVSFTIERGMIAVRSAEELVSALNDPNYATVNISVPVTLEGPLTIPAGYSVSTGIYDFSVQDTLTVYGVLHIKSESQSIIHTIENYGQICCSGTSHIQIRNLINHADAQFENTGTVLYTGSPVVNDGAVCNKGKIFYIPEEPFSPGVFDNAEGTIYSFASLPLDNVTVKLALDSPEAGFTLSYTERVYDASADVPLFLSNGTVLSKGSCYVDYLRDGQPTTDLTSAGTITLRISVKLESENACRGSITCSYTITPGTFYASTGLEVRQAFSNPNYSTVQLNRNLSDIISLTVPAGKTLDLGGKALQVSFLTNYGTVLNGREADFPEGYVPTAEDCLLTVHELENYGTIINRNIICTRPYESSTFVNREGGRLINEGRIYVNQTDNLTAHAGDGEIFTRRYLSTLDLTLAYTVTPYSGEEQRPSYVLTDPATGAVAEPDGCVSEYRNTVKVGTAYLELFIQGMNAFTPWYGTINASYEIIRGTVTVTTAQQLEQVLADPGWESIRLGRDLAVAGETLILKENVLLECGTFRLTITDGISPTVPASSSIHAELSALDDFEAYIGIATDMTLQENIGDGSRLIYISTDDYGSIRMRVDLNSHVFAAALKLYANTDKRIDLTICDDTASGTGAVTGAAGEQYAIYINFVDRGGASMSTTLRDIRVHGISFSGGNGKCTFDAIRCTFEAEEGRGVYIRNESINLTANFTFCTVTAPTGVFVGSGGKILFDSCTIHANGPYKATSWVSGGTGQGICVYFDRPLVLQLRNCTVTSENGYALTQFGDNSGGTYPTQTFRIEQEGGTYTGGMGSYQLMTPHSLIQS